MTFKSAVYIITMILTLESAFYVFNLNRRSILNILYTLFALDLAICTFVLYNISGAESYSTCLWWYRFNLPFGCFLPSLAIHFSLSLTEVRKAGHPLVLAAIYLPAAVFAVLMIFGGYFSAEFILTEWGWDVFIPFQSDYRFIFIIYYNAVIIVSAAIVYRWRYKFFERAGRMMAGSVFIPYAAAVAGIVLCPYFIFIESNATLNMAADMSGQIFFVIFVTGIRYSVKRYNSLDLTSEIRAGDLISGMSEPAFLVGLDGAILHHNSSGSELIDLDRVTRETSVFNIFDCPSALRALIDDLLSGRVKRKMIHCSVIAKGEIWKPVLLTVQSIHNFSGEISSVLVFIDENYTNKDFKEKYLITNRQMDIIMLALSGFSNREISEKLFLSERTVENHLFNIYNKLGVDNRIELFNIARKYNLISN